MGRAYIWGASPWHSRMQEVMKPDHALNVSPFSFVTRRQTESFSFITALWRSNLINHAVLAPPSPHLRSNNSLSSDRSTEQRHLTSSPPSHIEVALQGFESRPDLRPQTSDLSSATASCEGWHAPENPAGDLGGYSSSAKPFHSIVYSHYYNSICITYNKKIATLWSFFACKFV
jgi:hypothetical protein